MSDKYLNYLKDNAASWAKATRLMYAYGKIGKGIGWGTVGAIAAFGTATLAVPAGLTTGGGATGGGLSLSLNYNAARVIGYASTSAKIYIPASIAYGIIMPPGSPDLPGPGDDIGKSIRTVEGQASQSLGQRAEQFLPEAAKRLEAAKIKYGENGLVMMAKTPAPFNQAEIDYINLLRKSGMSMDDAIKAALEARETTVQVVKGAANSGGTFRDPYGIKKPK